MDTFTKAKRSEIMSRIRSHNTRAEVLVFRALRRRKIYFQKHYDKVWGKPDLALPRAKKAVFIDGDFWHGYRFAQLKKDDWKPYWREKITGNMRRDRSNRAKLRRAGWKVMKIWEHEINKQFEKSIERIALFLTDA